MGISGRTRFILASVVQEPIAGFWFFFGTEAKMTWRVVVRIPIGSIRHAQFDAFLILFLLPSAFLYLY